MPTMHFQHTPGPWRVCGGYTARYTAVTSPSGYIVFRMADSADDTENDKPIRAPSYEEQRANVRLIAAAPDLLEALDILTEGLEDSIEQLGENPTYDARVKMARAAIAKATGG